jgi:hypothetical protein
MQPGSIVILVDDNWNAEKFMQNVKRGCTYPVVERPYMVRITREDTNGLAILLEEIKNPLIDYKGTGELSELGFYAKRFKEIFPPINDVERWINQNSVTKQLV